MSFTTGTFLREMTRGKEVREDRNVWDHSCLHKLTADATKIYYEIQHPICIFFLERKNGTVSGKAVTQRNEVRWRSTEQGSIMIPGFRLATKLVSIHLCLKEHPYRSSPNIGCKDRKIKQKCSSRHVGPVIPPLMSLARRP